MEDLIKIREINESICDVFNPENVSEITKKFKTSNSDFKIMFVSNIYEVIEYALLNNISEDKEENTFIKLLNHADYFQLKNVNA